MGGEFIYQSVDDLMDFLYGREYSDERGIRGSLGKSSLTVPEWLVKVKAAFPKEVSERLENDALDRYALNEILTDKSVLEKMQPNMNLLKNILAFKGRMRADVLDAAKRIAGRVAEDLAKKLESDIMLSFSNRLDRSRSTAFRTSKNFDFKKTIRKNLKNYDSKENAMVLEKIYFSQRVKRFIPWEIVMCIDQSGSMLESVIYSAVMASIFSRLPVLRVKLVIFDTDAVDLSGYADDPADVLMSVQLGGGTDIGKALRYCEGLIETPLKSILILVSDLCDGAGSTPMYSAARRLIEAGVKVFALTGMDEASQGMYDKHASAIMAALGAKVASVTPGSLAGFIAEAIRG
jgi:predicted metal-dependent peptidase